ncbi:trifunctional serine/threonine-protein kinase/ATP-binding protein/sensor histidine kinase [Oscillatoria acuminata]|uniref:histidine kinase n=1 Tax=Oscillatoria acuminata PCC 6304 TaxID=56110 RepID=K9TFU4_9CYAN|nr:ATP-binding sensor histidine kinase [Oscillatoria acuminata]AFY81258.1 putative ATPase [Oscillatoria acuminata PCC 6304]
MSLIPGYSKIQEIQSGLRTVIYRAYSKRTQKPVIIKILKEEFPQLQDIARFNHEYELISSLNISGIVKPYRLEKHQNSLALVLEDFGGQSLKIYLETHELDLTQFLQIGIQLATTLAQLHQVQIVHKDIKPHNIIINPETGEVKIADFSIAVQGEKETPEMIAADAIEGTLAYMSPEQTGRMNRAIDYRTDLYSLGITFYEVLTGQLPFQARTPMEWIHQHIAKQPIPPDIRNAQIPPVLSEIVMKLIAKTPEDRYQSAWGVKVDLEICLNQLQTQGSIDSFAIALQDRTGKIGSPRKIYGRDREISILQSTFTRISQGPRETLLIAGHSGIGKSALVRQLQPWIRQHHGYFICGKFEHSKQNIPYRAVLSAFRDLICQRLTEPQDILEEFTETLQRALGANGQIIADVIPEIELLIGRQPAVSEQSPTDSQARFHRTFKAFVEVFTQPQHPLVLFLDDLQWADSASLKLIQLLMTEPESKYLMLVGTYRSNEVDTTHPLISTLNQMQKNGAVVNAIPLRGLELPDIQDLLSDTLNAAGDRIAPLAEFIYNKADGNPFFSIQLLQSLVQDNLLTFDFEPGEWQWDINRLQGTEITDDIIELTLTQIQKLPESTQALLNLAACMGNHFELNLLIRVSEGTESDTLKKLYPALQDGLIIPLIPEIAPNLDSGVLAEVESGEISYKFIHDRVQQAAYSLIPEDHKKIIHLKIGRLLCRNSPILDLDNQVFDVVEHLNLGYELIQDQAELRNLAKLNLATGQKAKSATAYEQALRYLQFGLQLLGEAGWQQDYEITFNLSIAVLEIHYLQGNFSQAEALYQSSFGQAKTLLDQVKLSELKILVDLAKNQPKIALETGLEVLNLLGVVLPTQDKAIRAYADRLFQEMPQDSHQIEALADLPVMRDPHQIAAMRLLMTISPAAHLISPAFLPAVVFTMVKLSIQSGNSPQAAYAYGIYAMLLCGIHLKIEAAYQFGQLSLRVLDQFNALELKTKVTLLYNVHIKKYKFPTILALQPLQDNIQTGLDTGDIEYGFYSALHYVNFLFFLGESLEMVHQKQGQYLEKMEQLKLDFHIFYIQIWRQMVLNLQGESPDPCRLLGSSFNEQETLESWIEQNQLMLLFGVSFCKTFLCYLFQNYEQAVQAGQLAEKYGKNGAGLPYWSEHNFYYSLSLLANCDRLDKRDQQKTLRKVTQQQKQLQQWAEFAPTNFRHKYDLVEAEKARVKGQTLLAMEYYDRAIQGAKKYRYIQEEAIAYERAALFYSNLGRDEIAHTYLKKAHYGYGRWGATAKLKALEANYPMGISQSSALEDYTPFGQITSTSTSTSTTSHNRRLDLTSALKASQAIASEIVLSKLIETLMTILMENAGAQTASLILKHHGKLGLKATASVENPQVILHDDTPLTQDLILPLSVINYVIRTKQSLVLNDARYELTFSTDPYIIKHQPKSILCTPILDRGQPIGLLYLENNSAKSAFTPERLEFLTVLSSQLAISLENSLLYANLTAASEELKRANEQLEEANQTLELRVQARTQQLKDKNKRLKQAMQELKQTQTQLIQTEKMSSLGQMIAGIAHEINNPVNFVYGNITHVGEYIQDLLNLIQLYQEQTPQPPLDIQEEIEAIELDFILSDLPKLLSSMKIGAERIRSIVLSLRNFSRLDESEMKQVDIHEGIESTLLILQHRLKGNPGHYAIEIIKDYGELPKIECFPGQLNQVFMNLLANAIDAVELYRKENADSAHRIPTIRIHTTQVSPHAVSIRIADNGPGIPKPMQSRLFDPFFTTKPVGSGTGLGLAICYQIIVEKHNGQIHCSSQPPEGAEFTLEIPIKQLFYCPVDS